MNDRLLRSRQGDLVHWSKPNAARVYDCLLGRKDNFRADRDAAAKLQELIPEVATAARANRQLLERMVSYLVGQVGIRQIIDIGTGFPAATERMLTLSQVAKLFDVSEKRISTWDRSGFLKASWRTPHGHRRWEQADVNEVLRHPEIWPVLKNGSGRRD